jgi:nitrogen fixation protein FixH
MTDLSLQMQTIESRQATLTFDPYPPAVMQETKLLLRLQDESGRPITGAKVTFDLTMPAMTMPPNKPGASDQGDGFYEAAAVYTMSGVWDIAANVSDGSGSQQFVFRLELK